MTFSTTLTVGDTVHEFTRDRVPYDDPIGRAQWRYRWACSCEGSGDWHTGDWRHVYRGWRKHVKNARERSTCGTD